MLLEAKIYLFFPHKHTIDLNYYCQLKKLKIVKTNVMQTEGKYPYTKKDIEIFYVQPLNQHVSSSMMAPPY